MAKVLKDKTANDLLHLIQAEKDRGSLLGGASIPRSSGVNTIFKLVTDLGDNLWAADQQVYNTTSKAYEDVDEGISTSADTPLLVEGGLVDEIVRGFPTRDIDNEPLWIGIKGGAAGIFILKITASTNISTYTANIIDNRTDETVIESAVTLKALDHSDGTIPNGNVLTCSYDSVNDFYEPTNYSIAYGVP